MTTLSRRGFLGAFLAGAGVLMLPIRHVQGGKRNADPSGFNGGSRIFNQQAGVCWRLADPKGKLITALLERMQ